MQNSMMSFGFIFCFRPDIFFAPKNQNCQFKLKFGTKTNLNMKNSMVMFVFSIFYWKYPFLEEICSKKSKFFVEAGIQTGRI